MVAIQRLATYLGSTTDLIVQYRKDEEDDGQGHARQCFLRLVSKHMEEPHWIHLLYRWEHPLPELLKRNAASQNPQPNRNKDISGAASVGIWFQRLLIELGLIQSTKCIRENNKTNLSVSKIPI